jgi:hypothetical protein
VIPDTRALLAGGCLVLGLALLVAVVSGSRALEQAAAWSLTAIALALALVLVVTHQARR